MPLCGSRVRGRGWIGDIRTALRERWETPATPWVDLGSRLEGMCEEIPASLTEYGLGRGTCIAHTRIATTIRSAMSQGDRLGNIVHCTAEATVPERLLDDVRVSMKLLQQQHAAAWQEVDRVHGQLRKALNETARLRSALAVIAAERRENPVQFARAVLDAPSAGGQ